ncbi:GIY-YIG nuclease family protein [Priestia megaterium]|uniref:GIY-YIG nuclease family protein n=1 Tax=Priestia megaterium TaxID=1404 RepID=UPI002E1F8197|nr:NUMOD3 domain-containing DNA-binding protein [Priestia megaterium]
MYYVYIHKHKLTEEVLYCGKGSNKRYKDYNSRGKEHLQLMKDGQLDYIILKYFNNEVEAYAYEEKLIEEYKKQGQCLFNINIGRKPTEETKLKLSNALKGKKRTTETKERMKKNHTRPLAKKVFMYKGGVLFKTFESSREAGTYAVDQGICSYGWCGRSLKTGEVTKPTKKFPLGGYLFQYEDAKMELEKAQ